MHFTKFYGKLATDVFQFEKFQISRKILDASYKISCLFRTLGTTYYGEAQA